MNDSQNKHGSSYGLVLAICASLTMPSTVLAAPSGSTSTDLDPSAQAELLRTEAYSAFDEGDYQTALDKFEAAHETSGEPTDLFNLGRIHEELGHLETALSYYERFVKEPHVQLEERRKAGQRIEVLRVLVDPGPEPETEPREGASVEPSQSQTNDDKDPGRTLIISGGVLAGVGVVVAAAGGIAFGVRGQRARDEVDGFAEGQNPNRLTLDQAEALDARGRNADVLQVTSIAAGSLVAVIGASLLVTGLVRKSKRRTPALDASVSRTMTMVSARWNF